MKMLKRVAALALSAVMAVGLLATPAMAAAGLSISEKLSSGYRINRAAYAGSITVMNAESDATYNAYRLFDLVIEKPWGYIRDPDMAEEMITYSKPSVLDPSGNGAEARIRDTDMASEMTNGDEDGDKTEDEPYYGYRYTITTSSPWYWFFSEGPGSDYVDLEKDESYGFGAMLEPMDECYIVEPTDKFVTEADAAELASLALAYMKANIDWDTIPYSWTGDGDDITEAESTIRDSDVANEMDAGDGDNNAESTIRDTDVANEMDAGDGDDNAEPGTNDGEAETRGLVQGQTNPRFSWNYHLPVMRQGEGASTVDLTGYGQSTTGWIAQATEVRVGYYLVDSTVGSLCAMDSTNYDMVISEKNARSTVTKQVWERGAGDNNAPVPDQWIYGQSGDNGTWGATSNTSVGEDVYFRTVITIGEDSKDNLILWDDMSAGNFRIKPDANDLHVYKIDADAEGDHAAVEVDWKTGDTANWVVDYSEWKAGQDILSQANPLAMLAYDEERDAVRLSQENGKVNYYGGAGNNVDDLLANYNMNLYKQNREIDDNGFCVRFMPEFCASLAEGDKLIVTYTAEWIRRSVHLLGGGTELEQEMSEYRAGGLNRTYVTYGTENPQMSGIARTYTFDHGFDLVKINSSKEILFGAKFTLKDASGKDIPLVREDIVTEPTWDVLGGVPGDGSTGEFDGVSGEGEQLVYYRPATQEERSVEGFESAVIEAGRVCLYGLDAGVYTLTETAAPSDDYNIAPPQTFEIVAGKDSNGDLDGSATLTIGSQSNIPLSAGLTDCEYHEELVGSVNTMPIRVKTLEKGTYVHGGLAIVNLTGSELPSTGGIGTTIFYAVGALLVIGAGILLITKKRMSAV